MRKTISHFVNVFPENININQEQFRMSQTHKDFYPKKTNKAREIKRKYEDEPQT